MILDLCIIANALIKRLEAAIHSSGRVTAYPEITPKMEFCPDWRLYVREAGAEATALKLS
jgi:hypothetical protein